MIIVKIAPSILSCNFSIMGEETKRMELAGADYIHLDVMDGHFVPNITFGAPVIRAIRPYSSLPFDVHLMIEHPYDYIDDFANAGADIITFHVESKSDIKGTIDKIKARGIKPGLVIKPKTPAETVFPYLKDIFMVLVMTVEPGFGGQKFMEDMLPKLGFIRAEADRQGAEVLLELDGGINSETISKAALAGADVCVAGTGIFKAPDAGLAIEQLKELCK